MALCFVAPDTSCATNKQANKHTRVTGPVNILAGGYADAVGGVAFTEHPQFLPGAGGLEMDFVKPCSRCVVTTINQTTAAGGKEPLRTLASFR